MRSATCEQQSCAAGYVPYAGSAVCGLVLQDVAKLQGSQLLRSADCYETAVGFISATDVTAWKVLHLNGPAIDLLGKECVCVCDV